MPIAMATEPQVRAPVVLVFADPPSLSDNLEDAVSHLPTDQ
jgi:hypothetical protein